MGEVKQSDIDIVVDALKSYRQRIIDEKAFKPADFVEFIEPKFIDAGYRHSAQLPRPRSDGNILIIHDTGVGDFILTSGAIREIRRLYPAAKIRLLVTVEAGEMARYCPYVDEILTHDSGINCSSSDFVGIYDWAVRHATPFLRERLDICYSFTHFYLTQFLMVMCGAKVRHAYFFENDGDPGNSPFLMLPMINCFATNLVPPFLYGTHHVDAYFSFLDAQMSVPIANRSIEIWCTRDEIEFGDKVLAGRVGTVYALNMGGSGPCKHYPPEKYAKVAEMIFEQEESTIVILGGGKEDLKSAEIFKSALPEKFLDNVIDLTNKINYRQSAAFLTHCTAYIGNDTGLLHAAAALNRPILAVYSFAADLPQSVYDAVRAYRPYNVPSVVIQPAKALPECADPNKPYSQYGCQLPYKPHCITQVKPETFLRGLQLLKERVAKKLTEPLYIF
ncbi:MAG: glycosyltransferase family 9 protein [Selenomonadaceae bacterium]|nr:glycosyltransferase family 9 protein [Selenomonadaceae bacterium]